MPRHGFETIINLSDGFPVSHLLEFNMLLSSFLSLIFPPQ